MNKSRWIKINRAKDLPNEEERVLISDGSFVCIGSCSLDKDNEHHVIYWEDDDGVTVYEITHWMPLPEPPEES